MQVKLGDEIKNNEGMCNVEELNHGQGRQVRAGGISEGGSQSEWAGANSRWYNATWEALEKLTTSIGSRQGHVVVGKV